MEENEVNALRKNYCAIIQDLDVNDVIDHLYQSRALSDDEVQDILACATHRERNRRLLYTLRHRPPDRDAYSKFCSALEQDYDFLVEKLRASLTPKERRLDLRPPTTYQRLRTARSYSADALPAQDYRTGDEYMMSCRGVSGTGRDPGAAGMAKESEVNIETIKQTTATYLGGNNKSCDVFGDQTKCYMERCLSQNNSNPLSLIDSATQVFNGTGKELKSRTNTIYPDTNQSFVNGICEYRTDINSTYVPVEVGIFAGNQYSKCTHKEHLRDGAYIDSPSFPDGVVDHSKVHTCKNSTDIADDEKECDSVCEELDAMFLPGPMVLANDGRQFRDIRLKHVFNRLSGIINRGQFDQFIHYRNELLRIRPGDADLACMMMYLESCTYLFKHDEDKCEETTERALMLVPATSAPSRFLVEILSLKCWLCLKNKRLNVLQGYLEDAFQVIYQDPRTCAGKSAGWMHVNEARRLSPMLTGSDVDRSLRLRQQAIGHFERSLDNFRAEKSKDGPFGYYFALIKMSQLRLACGDYMQTADIQPTEEDIADAEMRLYEAENATFLFPKLLHMNFCMAKSDLNFRRHNVPRALTYAQEGYEIAQTHACAEEMRYMEARVRYHESLLAKTCPILDIFVKQLDRDEEYENSPPQIPRTVRAHKNDARDAVDCCRTNPRPRGRRKQSREVPGKEISVTGNDSVNRAMDLNSVLGIVAIVVLGLIVIWQSMLLHWKYA